MNRYTMLTSVLMSLIFGSVYCETQQLEFKDGAMMVNHGSWWSLPTVNITNSPLAKPGATYLVNTVNKQIKIVGNGSTGPQVAFDNIGIVEGSSTATPGNLLYKNYIGSLEYTLASDKPGKRGTTGGGKRLYFCDGECIRK